MMYIHGEHIDTMYESCRGRMQKAQERSGFIAVQGRCKREHTHTHRQPPSLPLHHLLNIEEELQHRLDLVGHPSRGDPELGRHRQHWLGRHVVVKRGTVWA